MLWMMPLSVNIPPTAPVGSASTSWWGLAPQRVVESCWSPLSLAEDMADELKDLLVAVSRLRHAGQGGGGQTLCPLLLHQLVFPLFGLWKLCGYNHEAQVDHEEWSNLDGCGATNIMLEWEQIWNTLALLIESHSKVTNKTTAGNHMSTRLKTNL